MNTRRYYTRIWTAAALFAVGPAAFAQDAPVPAQIVSPVSAAPATAMTPVPMSEYVQQEPLPLVPKVAPILEQTNYAGSNTPPRSTAMQMTVVPAPSFNTNTQASAFRPMTPTVGTMAAPNWRWYGWGAATQPGFASANNAAPVPPATNNVAPPTTTPNPAPTMPPAPVEIPKVSVPVVPVMDAVKDATWIPSPAAAPIVAPPVAAPAVDINPLPKPIVPPNTGPAVEPWNGVSPPGAKAVGEWRTVRASSAK